METRTNTPGVGLRWPDRAAAILIIFAITAGTFAGRAIASADGQRAQAAFAQTQQALDHGDLEAALADVQQGLRDAPHSITGLNLLGIILAQQGKRQQALAALEAALKVNPRSVATHNDLGSLYVALKEPQLAERQFRAALREAPADHDANYNLGVLLLSRGHARTAIQCFRAIRPPDLGTLFYLTNAYLSSNETQEGLKIASLLSEQGKNDVRVHFSLGVLLTAKKQYGLAEHELEAADALAPDTFEILYNLGQVYLRDGKAGEAELTLRRAVRARANSVAAIYSLAQAETAEGKDVDALDQLVRAHHLAPQNTDVILLMARVSMKQSYFEDAIPLLEEGLKITPKRADLHAALGRCYFTVGQTQKALQEFQTLIKLAPTAHSYVFLGDYYRNLSRFDEAKKCFFLGLAKDPGNAVCMYNLGLIASRRGQYADAEKWFTKTVAVKPNYNDALFALASVKMSERQYAAAIPLLRRCATLDRDPASDYYKLMIAERNMHRMQAAETDANIYRTLAKDPETEPYPFQHLFDYLNKLEGMSPKARRQIDLSQLLAEIKRRPDEPRNFYMLAQAYLQLGQRQEAEKAIAQLDEISGGDARTMAGAGVLLAGYHLYPEAIRHFELSLQADPASDNVKYDLALVYFRVQRYGDALSVLGRISLAGQKQESVLALLADTEAHVGRMADSIQNYRQAIRESPDNDQNYLSLALAQMQARKLAQARDTLSNGLARIPDSGKLFWGMGVLLATEGRPQQAITYLRKSVDLLPEWPGSYSALGILYFQTGQIEKARATLREISQNGLQPAFDVRKIDQALSAATDREPYQAQRVSLSPQNRHQFLQLAMTLADETL